MAFPEPLDRLIRALEKLPGVGARSAERLALHVLRSDPDEVAELAMALRDARMDTMRCEICGNVTLASPCRICGDAERDQSLVCVVEGPREIEKLEIAAIHSGVYHVLMDGFSPREGNEPEPRSLSSLRRRVKSGLVKEIVLATAPDREGEGAAQLVMDTLEGCEVNITRLARGLPVGARLEYLHGDILAEAFRGRRQVDPPEQG